MSTQSDGILYEVLAEKYLKDKGYEIIDRNYLLPKKGELDIVAKKDSTLVIVEVKYRTNETFGHPIESITRPKVKSILKATEHFLSETNVKYNEIRFDVICFLGDVIEHIEDAFYGYFY